MTEKNEIVWERRKYDLLGGLVVLAVLLVVAVESDPGYFSYQAARAVNFVFRAPVAHALLVGAHWTGVVIGTVFGLVAVLAVAGIVISAFRS